jgi:hypothetical protein
MTSNLRTNLMRYQLWNSRRGFLCLVAVLLAFVVMPAHAQSFSSGSDGSDGAYAPTGAPGTIIVFDPAQFHGTQVAANIFNFTTITIPGGVTVQLSGNNLNGPVYWLASGAVDIEGTIDLSGGQGAPPTLNPFARIPSVPGSGGYAGGVGAGSSQGALPGNGPGGGFAGTTSSQYDGGGGTFSGNQFLIPLLGGSGGGGGVGGTYFGGGGGAGGGAILIASSVQILANGRINASGGNGAPLISNIANAGGGGSGGAVRLVSNTINGIGIVSAAGGTESGGNAGGNGVVRLEAFSLASTITISGSAQYSSPFPLLLPTVGPTSAQVISINGTSITPNPSTFPDITINTTSAVPVVIQTQNIPTTSVITLTILDENGVADTVVQAPPLGSCNASNVCTTTVDVTFPFGASRGLTKVTWTH